MIHGSSCIGTSDGLRGKDGRRQGVKMTDGFLYLEMRSAGPRGQETRSQVDRFAGSRSADVRSLTTERAPDRLNFSPDGPLMAGLGWILIFKYSGCFSPSPQPGKTVLRGDAAGV